jgi:hypothetical protein
MQFPEVTPTPSSATPQPRPRAIDLFNVFPTEPPSAETLRPYRALDLLESFPVDPIPPASTSRPIKNLPRRVQTAKPKGNDNNFIDLTLPSASPPSKNEVIELTDSDTEMEDATRVEDPRNQHPPSINIATNSDSEMRGTAGPSNTRPSVSSPELSPDLGPMPYVFHTNDELATRQTIRSWHGTLRAEDWIPSREDLHADEVDRSRILPLRLLDDDYPIFVSFKILNFIAS